MMTIRSASVRVPLYFQNLVQSLAHSTRLMETRRSDSNPEVRLIAIDPFVLACVNNLHSNYSLEREREKGTAREKEKDSFENELIIFMYFTIIN